MKKYLYLLVATLGCMLMPSALRATHNRAGEIHVRQVGPLTVEATIITWTKSSSVSADRDTLDIDWGDGTNKEAVLRSNGGGKGVDLPNDIRYNIYVARHTYAGPACYKISMSDPNRIVGIVNVNPPSSDNVPFHIETIYCFQDLQFGGYNTTPYLRQPPIDNACVGQPFRHNPNAFDPDRDSLSYRLIQPLQAVGVPVPNYSFPNQIAPGPNNTLYLNERTGDLLWASPQARGEYNIAMIIISWRNGMAIDTTIRDMQIFVADCKNRPPVVETIDRICVVAGQTINFPVKGLDPDSSDLVKLTALGGPLDSNSSSRAVFTVPTGFRKPPVNGTLRWTPDCSQISSQFYTIVFKATDSLNTNTPQLSDLKTVSVKVVGPAPEGLKAVAKKGEVELSWDKPYFCENAPDRYFYGFSVWRKEGSTPFMPDTCSPGLEGKGYTRLVFRTVEMKDGRYYFKDTKVERGRTYCYRVVAKFAKVSPAGYPFNLVDGLASKEVCAQLPRDLPLITNVSVLTTSASNGRIELRWSKPVAQDLDTVLNPGPYRYQLLRAPDFGTGNLQPVPGASFISSQFWKANDTVFIDNSLNTLDRPYRYQVAFYVRGESTPLGFTNEASSVFLNVGTTDQACLLSWKETVPWGNYQYEIYRKNAAGDFDFIGTSVKPEYIDRGLTNGQGYCYRVKSIGTYSIGGVIDPILNFSQESCNIPFDTVPPCAPVLTVGNLCNGLPGVEPDPPFENNLSWTNPNTTCSGTDDAVAYRIWFAGTQGQTLQLLTTQEGADNTTFLHQLADGLAGCYAVSALDSVGNESRRSQVICVDNCPEYLLPNAFTPNDDDSNDLFTPFPGWRFVDQVLFQVFNRWGNVVFETSDPALNWNGQDSSGKPLSEGTYFYICKVFERRVEGVVLRPGVLSGYIELVRGKR